MAAPCTVIVGYDMAFYDKLPVLVPHTDARGWFSDSPEADLSRAALRSSRLPGAYLILAARAPGLACCPLSVFDPAQVDAPFFAGTTIRPNFIVTPGRGHPA